MYFIFYVISILIFLIKKYRNDSEFLNHYISNLVHKIGRSAREIVKRGRASISSLCYRPVPAKTGDMSTPCAYKDDSQFLSSKIT